MQKILVTGASGFIGTHLCGFMQQQGWQPVPWRIRFGAALAFPGSAFAVVHLAGLAHAEAGRYSYQDYIEANCELTVAAAKEAIAQDVQRFVYLSSVKACAYDTSDPPNSEVHQLAPDSAYGESKLAAEAALHELDWRACKLTVLRPCLVYGPGAKANFGRLLSAARCGMLPYLRGGEPRSMLAVENLCSAIDAVLVADSLGPTYIVADKEAYTIEQISTWLKAAAGGVQLPLSVSASFLRGAAQRIDSIWPGERAGRQIAKLVDREDYSAQKLQDDSGWLPSCSLQERAPALFH